jgi:hypothetical protein
MKMYKLLLNYDLYIMTTNVCKNTCNFFCCTTMICTFTLYKCG